MPGLIMLGRILAVGSMLVALSTSCESSDPNAPLDALPSAEEPLVGEGIPDWAAGHTFTRHTGDITWFHVNPDGSAFAMYDGGDVRGGGCAQLAVVDGRLHAPLVVKTYRDEDRAEEPTLVRTVDGRYFAHAQSGYTEYVRADLCGRDGGGCGGYGSVGACTAAEMADRTALWSSCPAKLAAEADGGVDASISDGAP